MKKIYLLWVSALVATQVSAQLPLIEDANGKPVKLADIVTAYEQEHGVHRTPEEEGGKIREGKHYQFDRWRWYWEHHLDEKGYMVSAAANYLEAMKLDRTRMKTTVDQSDWKLRGPFISYSGYGGIGRINCIEFHPTDSNTYWVGASGGGIWKTTNDGMTWTSLSDNLPRTDVSDIDVNPLNTNTIYLCTGDRDGGSASYNNNNSIGVLKSTDGGQTWNTTGISWTTSQGRTTNWLLINPLDTNSLTLATSLGIYKSFNGGATWSQRQSGNFIQVLYHPTDTSIMYGSRNSDDREIYRSSNGGMTWSVVTNLNNARRITLAITPANVALVRAMVCNSGNGLMGIYESVDTGKTFTQVYAPTGTNCNASASNAKTGDLIASSPNGKGCGVQGWYDLAFVIHPQNPNIVFAGGVNTWGSTNGGRNWTLVNQWTSVVSGVQTVHADKHYYAYHPLTGELFECNDGGIYKTRSPFSPLWTDISNGLSITQFYRNAVSNAATGVLGGSQDNGSKGLQGATWYDLTGGDGMDCQADPIDSNVYYTSTQNGGSIYRTLNGGGSISNIQNNIPGDPSGGWITPYIITPDSNRHLVAGFKHIYFSPDRGNSWMSIQGSAITGGNCTRVAMTGGPTPTIYAIFPDTQVVFYADNYVRGNTATFDTIKVPYSGTISDIKPHATDSGRFYLTFSGYGNTKVAQYNNGVWSQLNTGLPSVPVRCIDYDTAYQVMYVGTDLGVFYMDSTTAGVWASFRKNMPFIEVLDIAINNTTKEVWAATYGRGMWSSVLQGSVVIPPDTTDTTDTTNIVVVIPYADDVFKIAPNPAKDNFKIIAGPSMVAGKAITVNIIDYTGKTVWRRQSTFNGGQADISTENLVPGVYIVELSDERAVLGRKRIILQ